jgi:hypothetical protein
MNATTKSTPRIERAVRAELKGHQKAQLAALRNGDQAAWETAQLAAVDCLDYLRECCGFAR